jgi:type IV secretion system protein VirB5
MRFKKPQVRYADTSQPATPYQAAGQVWDDRIVSARRACRRRTGG